MKQAKWKGVLLAVYITAVLIVRANAEQLNSFTSFFLTIVLGYCGIIVVAQLVSAIVQLCDWLTLVIGNEPQADFFAENDLDVKKQAS